MNTKDINNNKGGYSLVELLFVLGMVFLLASISLVNYNRFGKEVDLENSAYDVALEIRTAQFFGINRKDDIGSLVSNFDEPKPYGVFFKTSLLDPIPGVSQESFLVFVDRDGGAADTNNLFDNAFSADSDCISNSSTECFDVKTLGKGVFISELCAGNSEADCTVRDELHITFKRPNPDATIKSSPAAEHAYAEITLSSPVAGVTPQRITVGTAGQISIK